MADPITFTETSEELAAMGFFRTVFGSSQNYRPLPAIVYDPAGEMRVVTRWRPTEDERRRELVGALVQEVYVDIAERRVTGLVAVPEFDGLLRQATFEAEGVVLVEMRGLEPSAIATPRDADTTLHVPQRERYWLASWRAA